MMNKDFSLDDFKKWIKQQEPVMSESKANNGIVGSKVLSKIGLHKLISKIELEEGVDEIVANEFFENGGTIIDVDKKNFLIEVTSGKFYLHRVFVQK